MHHCDGAIAGKGRVEIGAVHQIALDEGAELYRLGPAGGEIVEGHGLKTRPRPRFAGMGANIARTSGDQYSLHNGVVLKSIALFLAQTGPRAQVESGVKTESQHLSALGCRRLNG